MQNIMVLAVLVIMAFVPLLSKGAQGQEFTIPEREVCMYGVGACAQVRFLCAFDCVTMVTGKLM